MALSWEEPTTFCEALDLHLRRHGESTYYLQRALVRRGCMVDYATLWTWRLGRNQPGTVRSLDVLAAIVGHR